MSIVFFLLLVNLRAILGVLTFNAIIEKTNTAGKSRLKAIASQIEKKLHNLQKFQQSFVKTEDKQCPVKRNSVMLRGQYITISHRTCYHTMKK